MAGKLLKRIKKGSGKANKDILDKLDAYASRVLSGQQDDDDEASDQGSSKNMKSGKISARQKKKLRKLRRQELKDETFEPNDKEMFALEPKKNKKQRFLEEMGLDLTNLSKQEVEKDTDKPSLPKSIYHIDEKVVVFRDLAKKRPKIEYSLSKNTTENVEISNNHEEEINEFNMKKARHEVLRFGISGFEKASKEQANMALAIKLGAKPPKNSFKNYRELMEEKKHLKLVEKDEMNLNVKPGLLRTASSKKNKARDRNKVAGFDSQIGRYKNGMQLVSKREIQKVIQGSKKGGGKIGAIKGL